MDPRTDVLGWELCAYSQTQCIQPFVLYEIKYRHSIFSDKIENALGIFKLFELTLFVIVP